jgi:ATP-dependent protease Clp ATPase subunit
MNSTTDSLSCSFCSKAQSDVAKLVSSPGGRRRAYICNECILVCASILDDQADPAISFNPGTPVETSPLMRHRLAPEFMNSVERWIRKDSLGSDASEEFAKVRSIASRMVAGK